MQIDEVWKLLNRIYDIQKSYFGVDQEQYNYWQNHWLKLHALAIGVIYAD